MIILIDLDGTLVNTAEAKFKPMKDGLVATVITDIPVFQGAQDFVRTLSNNGHIPLIISDSHPKYVNPIASEIFGISALSLSDKPNTVKTAQYLTSLGHDINVKDNFIVIGDTWLDIEMGRGLNFKTILTQFYKAKEIEERDGIGKTWNQLKSGPAFVASNYTKVLNIINQPVQHAWAAEAVFQNSRTFNAFKLYSSTINGQHTLFRSLGRQETGECDNFGVAQYYTEFQRADRSEQSLKKLAESVNAYVGNLVASYPTYKWDWITYVSDKASTNPPDKMRNFFTMIDTPVMKVDILKWSDSVEGTIRNMADYKLRRGFISKNLELVETLDLNGKSIIVLDDQFTTGGTAHEIVNMLRKKGVADIMFLTLFFMVSMVSSERVCPKCNKKMVIKIRKIDGNKFYSCTPPKYRGIGCGHAVNI